MCRESTAGFLTGLGTHSRVGSGGPFLDHVVVSSAQQHEVARALANRLGIPHLELDSIFHQPGWEPRSDDEFRAEAAAFVAGERWVVDGNYTSHGVTEIVWPRADTIVWLDPPRRVVMRRVVSRTLRRVVTREELWNGNREPWTNLYSRNPYKNIIVWAWTRFHGVRHKYEGFLGSPQWSHLRVIRLRSSREVKRLLAGVV